MTRRGAVLLAWRASLDLHRLFRDDRRVHFFSDIVLWLPKHLFPESVGCFKNPSGAGYICPDPGYLIGILSISRVLPSRTAARTRERAATLTVTGLRVSSSRISR